MSVTIQINSVAALERLLQGEGDEQVTIKKAVLLEYERRHVLPVIEAIVDHLGKSTWQGLKLKEVKAIAGVQADQLLSSQIRAAVKEMVEQHLASYVNAELTSQIRRQILVKLGEG